ncbi:MAG: hypothetical protein JSU81_00575 [Candidatus Coatesbacteria bacterium]|nr:MAG: hypothetical protein JSU81_00575 [Candidatus Coatesbacteria bacterium]
MARWAGVGLIVFGVLLSCDGEEPEYDGVWEVVPTPKCLAGVRDICFVTPNDGWAVAGHQIWHYDGSSWSLFRDLHPADPRYDYGLTQVWFNGPNDGWFAGDEMRSQSDYRSRMWHYDGSSFKEVAIPDVRHIYKLWFNAPDDGWAFGGYYALRYDGQKWYRTDFPTYRWKCCFFWGPNDGWATGVVSIWRWNGVNWDQVKEVSNELRCVAFPARNLGWAMGDRIEYSGEAPVYRYDGSKWTNHEGPFRPADRFYDIEFVTVDYGWAVGLDSYFWDGEFWTYFEVPADEVGGKGAYCIECVSEEDVWVGATQGRILRFKGFK